MQWEKDKRVDTEQENRKESLIRRRIWLTLGYYDKRCEDH